MKDLKHWQDKIKQKRKQTDFRDFLKQIASWQPLVFYKNQGIVTRFPQTDRMKEVVKYENFYEQNGAAFIKGLEYDFGKDVFQNFSDLWGQVKGTSMINFFMSQNSDYADVVSKGKNVYLSSYVVNGNEDIVYCFGVNDGCTRVFSSNLVSDHSENIYNSLAVYHSFNVFYSRYINNCSDIWWSTNLLGCTHCIACHNLENVSYCIENIEYEKDEYISRFQEYVKNKYSFHNKYVAINKIVGKSLASKNITGSFGIESCDVQQAHFIYRVKNGNNVFNVGAQEGCENIYDVCDGGGPTLQDIYGVNGVAIGTQNCYISCHIPNCNSIFYSYYLESCSFCFGCIGLKNREYCILNKQYSKEDWHKVIDQIFTSMEADEALGEFFPGSLNPFYFNDTIAGLIGNFSRSEVEVEGYMWRDKEIKADIPEGSEIIEINTLNKYQGYDEKGEWKINPEILNKVIVDEKGNYYRIVQMEYDFLIKHSLPLPEIHWMDRMKLNFGV